ncbi:hypothetical protein BDU57DRAFT_517059 [Ampelomyces quisqualis]|uniref:C2H2-type domain-containing protein n=1 Tax=Ampelomyces quisqualis TaxID=50730 RepID=A0A6A5QMU2_AMPQU|nr:hypothetical protein BDU57DRAFT_517059 [Ampelomyces quisqualis]
MGRKMPASYHCGLCDRNFTSKSELMDHTLNHAENAPEEHCCQICNSSFNDLLSLEDHKIKSGHNSPQHSCENCGKGFISPRGLAEHVKPPFGCSQPPTDALKAPKAEPITCERCSVAFGTRQAFENHRSFKVNSQCADHNYESPPRERLGEANIEKPGNQVSVVLGYAASSDEVDDLGDDVESNAPTNLSDDALWCSRCKNRFESLARYSAHALWCTTKHGSRTKAAAAREPEVQAKTGTITEPPQAPPSPKKKMHPVSKGRHGVTPSTISGLNVTPEPCRSPTPSGSITTSTSIFNCNVLGCEKSYRSEAGLKVHKADTHGIGGKKVDLMGKDSWMLGQRAREQLKSEGLLQRPPPGNPRSGDQSGRLAPHPAVRQPLRPLAAAHRSAPAPIPAFATPHTPVIAPVQHTPVRASIQHTLPRASVSLPTSRIIGGPFEMEQAKFIQGKILRLLIHSDIFIHPDGKITVCGIEWKRIGVERQPDAIGMFDSMCHLPKMVQGEYLPPPKAFLADYKLQYPSHEFKPSPPRDSAKPGIAVVVIACATVVLADGLKEVVKIAAIDLLTCRILMNHLVCTDATAQVKDWRSNETGLYSWNDMEHGRKLGYKVFKGWSAARSALWKFVDKDTIVVGHNLRSELDALRMVHGRAVDVAKVAEKAANGPLSNVALGLDSMCRDFLAVLLKSDPEYGRDVLMNAFAAREMGLWIIKNKEAFEKRMKQKSLEYQVVMPRTAMA